MKKQSIWQGMREEYDLKNLRIRKMEIGGSEGMPLISEFYGIKIYMYWDDHIPPHFHAEYGNSKVLIDIKNVVVLRGIFPTKQLKIILAWCELHKEELLSNWESAKNHGILKRIQPLQ